MRKAADCYILTNVIYYAAKEVPVLKAMIVDDEAPARSELRFLLDETGQTEVVA